jgi:multiple sugar transport system permease protein
LSAHGDAVLDVGRAQLGDRLGFTAPNALSDTWMLPSLGNSVTWEFAGYNMIILYAARPCPPGSRRAAPADPGRGAAPP